MSQSLSADILYGFEVDYDKFMKFTEDNEKKIKNYYEKYVRSDYVQTYLKFYEDKTLAEVLELVDNEYNADYYYDFFGPEEFLKLLNFDDLTTFSSGNMAYQDNPIEGTFIAYDSKKKLNLEANFSMGKTNVPYHNISHMQNMAAGHPQLKKAFTLVGNPKEKIGLKLAQRIS